MSKTIKQLIKILDLIAEMLLDYVLPFVIIILALILFREEQTTNGWILLCLYAILRKVR